jgi:hypothetical protein
MALYARPNNPELDAVKVPSALDVAWAAGVYEGEGTVRNCGRGKRSLTVGIPQKDPELLYWLRNWFGGSVNPPSGGNNCYHLDLCGDRARLFIAQIYSRLTSRRKSQVDVTNCLGFLEGRSPEGMALDELKSAMGAYYQKNFALTEKNPIVRRAHQSARYHKNMENPEFQERIRQQSERQRKRMTPEQREAFRQYQRTYYAQKRANSKLHVVEKAS